MPLEFYTSIRYRRYFRDTRSATHNYRQDDTSVLLLLVELNLADKIGNGLSPLLGHPIITVHQQRKDDNSSSGHHDLEK